MAKKTPAPRQVSAIPLINKGDPITASYLNTIGNTVNALSGVNSPRDLDAGADADEAPNVTLREYERTSSTVRVENPQDENQYVDVERPGTVTLRRLDTGESWVLIFNND